MPPRREPRVLALSRQRQSLVWAVADPWELRGAGVLGCPERSEGVMLRRLIRREKPTAVVSAGGQLAVAVERAARSVRVPFVRPPAAIPPRTIAAELYPELPLFAPDRAMQAVASLAIAVVLHSPIPTRRYATRRHPPAPCTA